MISTSARVVPIIYGEGASATIGEKAKELGMTKVLLVCDKGVVDAGIVDPIVGNLKKSGVAPVIFDRVKPDPPDYVVDEAGALGKSEKVNGVIGIGGGSALDTAKGANILQSNPGSSRDWLFPAVPQKGLPLLVVPTTAGTGSEATYVAIVTNTATNQKIGILGDACYADFGIVDPVLYTGLPEKVTIAGAFDAYTHSVDTILSPNPAPYAETFAEKSLRLIHKYLPKVLQNGKDIEARSAMALAATMGGGAINGAMCHLTHAIGHSFGSVFHLQHGHGCAICLPELLEFYAEINPAKTRLVGEAMGLVLPESMSNKELGQILSAAALDFMTQCKLPTLKEMGYSLDDIEPAIKMMHHDAANLDLFTPKVFSEDEFRSVVHRAYAR